VPGLAGFEAWPWQGFVVPAKTPDAVIGKLRDTYVAAVADVSVTGNGIGKPLQHGVAQPERRSAHSAA
jgi:hypothetical protein